MPGRTTAAKRYAEAVAAIARQENSWEQWRRDFGVLREALAEPRLRVLLTSPRVEPGQRRDLLDQAFGSRVAPATLNLMKVMGRRGRLGLFEDLLVWFDEMADREQGIRRYHVTSAAPLSDAQRERLRTQLGSGRNQVILTEQVDESLIGGLILRHEDMIRDYSIKTRLDTLREHLN
jgi:F-type H+-transporting ATPase subunit delta